MQSVSKARVRVRATGPRKHFTEYFPPRIRKNDERSFPQQRASRPPFTETDGRESPPTFRKIGCFLFLPASVQSGPKHIHELRLFIVRYGNMYDVAYKIWRRHCLIMFDEMFPGRHSLPLPDSIGITLDD